MQKSRYWLEIDFTRNGCTARQPCNYYKCSSINVKFFEREALSEVRDWKKKENRLGIKKRDGTDRRVRRLA